MTDSTVFRNLAMALGAAVAAVALTAALGPWLAVAIVVVGLLVVNGVVPRTFGERAVTLGFESGQPSRTPQGAIDMEPTRLPLETLPDPAWVVSQEGEVVDVNERWLQYTGLTREQTLEGGWLQAVHPDQVATALKARDRALEAGGNLEQAVKLRSAGGQYRWFLVRAQAMRSDSGRISWTGVCTDIDELRQQEESLSEQVMTSQEHAELVDLAHDAILIRSMGGEIRYWNRGAEVTYGFRKPEAYGQIVHSLLQTQFARPLQQIENHLLRHGRWEGTVVQFHRDGSKRVIASRWALKRDETGSPQRVLEINSDITERRQAEQSLQFLADASETLASLVDYHTVLQKLAQLAVPFLADWCVVYHENKEGRVVRVARLHVDSGRQQLLDQIEERFPLQKRDPPALVARVLRDGEAELAPDFNEALLRLATFEDEEHRRLVRALGSRSLICLPLQVRGKVCGAVVFVTDGSSRRYSAADLAVAEDFLHRVAVALENARLYAEAREADRRKDEFLATLAHELRNPLAPIRNAVELMHLRGIEDEQLVWARDAIDRQAQHLTRLVDDLLDISRITRGKVELRKQTVDVNTIVSRAVETARTVIDQHEHTLEVHLADCAVWVDADPTRLEQIFANLLNNAAKYTEFRGRIRVAVECIEDHVAIRVSDTGIGIPSDLLPRVFDMFVQAEQHRGRAQGGLGIGLSLVHRLVAMHGGAIEAHSEGPGKGSEFIVRLPCIEPGESGKASKPSEIELQSPTSREILVVDDNIDAAKSLAMLLRMLGQNARVAHDGESAFDLLDQQPSDLVFLDIGLPQIDGYEVARRIRSRPDGNRVQLVALTGWGQEDDRRRSRAAGFDDHLTKPVDQVTLQRILYGIRGGRSESGNAQDPPPGADG